MQTDNQNDVRGLLLWHAQMYPLMRPRDAVKLLYQGEFGGGHIVSNPAQSLEAIVSERSSLVPVSRCIPPEDIGGGLCRLYLESVPNEPAALAALNRAFTAGSAAARGSADSFLKKLELLRNLSAEGVTPFTAGETLSYLDEYIKSGTPMERHSDEYRDAYSPAYRVIPQGYAPCLKLMAGIEKTLAENGRAVISIDGFCGSGKTSLAAILAEIYACPVISMDDFFLPPSLRTGERLDEPGGNIHYERFLDEAVSGIISGEGFSYRVFDCGTMDYAGFKNAPSSPVIICEGSYAMHPKFGDLYSYRVFVKCPPEEQRRRIVKRSGQLMYERFEKEWIPMEQRYFSAFGIEELCDYTHNT